MRGNKTRIKRLNNRLPSPHKTMLIVTLGNGKQTPVPMTSSIDIHDAQMVAAISDAQLLSVPVPIDCWNAL